MTSSIENSSYQGSSLERIRSLLFIAASIMLGLLGCFCLLDIAIQKECVPHDVARIINKADFLSDLKSKALDKPLAIVFGNSITIEGIDAEMVKQAADGSVQVANIAESAAGVRRFLLNAEKCFETDCRYLIGMFRPRQLLEGGWLPLSDELANAYCYAGYINPETQEPKWVFNSFSPEDLERLPKHHFEVLAKSRVFLQNFPDDFARRIANRGQRLETFASNFNNPWRYTLSVKPAELTEQIEAARLQYQSLRYVPNARPMSDLLAVVERAERSDTKVLIVLLSEHPGYRDDIDIQLIKSLKADLHRLCSSKNAEFVSLPEDFFEEDDFVDYQHPNEKGRVRLSNWMGEQLIRLEMQSWEHE